MRRKRSGDDDHETSPEIPCCHFFFCGGGCGVSASEDSLITALFWAWEPSESRVSHLVVASHPHALSRSQEPFVPSTPLETFRKIQELR